MDYYTIEPFGELRADLRNAILCALIANQHRNPEKKSTPYTLSDFMPFKEEAEEESDDGEAESEPQDPKANLSSETLSYLFVASAKRPKV